MPAWLPGTVLPPVGVDGLGPACAIADDFQRQLGVFVTYNSCRLVARLLREKAPDPILDIKATLAVREAAGDARVGVCWEL